jgi:superfamily II DNA or RNA helicase
MTGTDWRGLERVVARLMAHCGWRDVALIGRPGDQGADIVAVRDEDSGPKTWAVQVKAVSGGNYVSKPALREVLKAQSVYGAHIAAVATNGEFTTSATEEKRALERIGFAIKFWNGAFLEGLLAKFTEDHSFRRNARPYQQTVIDATLAKFDSGSTRAQYVVATGLGKTVIAAKIAREFWNRGIRRILVLCHAQDLASQLEQGFWSELPKEAPTRLFYDGEPPLVYDGVNFGLYQSLRGYMSAVEAGAFELVIVDEAHHALAFGFRTCVEELAPRYLVGMTATPWRGDGASLDDLFGEPVARVSLIDGMQMGFLAQVDYRLYCDNIDWEVVPKLSKGSYSIRDLNKRLFLPQRDDAVVAEIVRNAKNLENPRIAVFSPSVSHAHRFAEMLTAAGLPCAPLSGVDRVDRRRYLMEFGWGRLSAVTAVDVMNEGIDVPDVNIIVFMRATHSRRIFIQQLGRGLRLAADKEKVLVLDFVSDLRRLAELSEMDKEIRRRTIEAESVYIANSHVSFTDARAARFVETWLADVADLADSDDTERLRFPEVY